MNLEPESEHKKKHKKSKKSKKREKTDVHESHRDNDQSASKTKDSNEEESRYAAVKPPRRVSLTCLGMFNLYYRKNYAIYLCPCCLCQNSIRMLYVGHKKSPNQ